MSEEKQIEKLRGVLWCNPYVRIGSHDANMLAQYLTNEGYRKQSEVIDDFVERLMEAPIKCRLPLLGLSTKDEIEEYFNDIMFQVRNAINSTAKEMKGGE